MGDLTSDMVERLRAATQEAKADEVTTAYLKSMNLEPTPDILQHLMMLEGALIIYAGRTDNYGQAWRDFGAVGNALNLARKAKRVWVSFRHNHPSLTSNIAGTDDAFDCINYAVFYIRSIAEGNLDG